eukprot:6209863-Pleurochrysis_carterae.AAC.3
MAGIAEISSHESAPALLTAADLLPPDTNTANMVEGVHLLQGELRYYHYGLQGFADHGWGCGYRTIQSILSWLAPSELPLTIPKMQALLRETNGSSFFGSRSWVGVTDAVQILDSIHDATVIVRTLKSGREAMSLLPELITHFDLGGGPVMIGGGSDVYSKTVVGVSEGLDARTASLLIWDPHYSDVTRASVPQALRPFPLQTALLPETNFGMAAGYRGSHFRRKLALLLLRCGLCCLRDSLCLVLRARFSWYRNS